MIDPTRALIDVLEKHGARLTAFVDAGFLLQLKNTEQLGDDYRRVAYQLKALIDRGHDVQLHVHPHWEDSVWKDGQWQVNTNRYKLHDFSEDEINRLCVSYCQTLEEVTGRAPIAYRAGGWCLQPWEKIAAGLRSAGVRVDSTVYEGGQSVNPGREFDFRGAPSRDWWNFSSDPLVPDQNGDMVEIPISTVRVPPSFYWRMLHRKVRPVPELTPFGDGQALTGSSSYYLRKLTRTEQGVASIDGARADLLERAYQQRVEQGGAVLNVMGHPKSITPYSLQRLDDFLSSHSGEFEFHTMDSLAAIAVPQMSDTSETSKP